MDYTCQQCGSQRRIRSFRMQNTHCLHCGAPDAFPAQVSNRVFVDMLVGALVVFAGFWPALGVASVALWLFRLITGNPNGGMEFAVMVWMLSFLSAISTAFGFIPMASGKWIHVSRTDEERRKLRLISGGRAVIRSATVVGLFVFLGPDLPSKMALVLFWLLWVCLFVYPSSKRASHFEWQDWRPSKPASAQLEHKR